MTENHFVGDFKTGLAGGLAYPNGQLVLKDIKKGDF